MEPRRSPAADEDRIGDQPPRRDPVQDAPSPVVRPLKFWGRTARKQQSPEPVVSRYSGALRMAIWVLGAAVAWGVLIFFGKLIYDLVR